MGLLTRESPHAILLSWHQSILKINSYILSATMLAECCPLQKNFLSERKVKRVKVKIMNCECKNEKVPMKIKRVRENFRKL